MNTQVEDKEQETRLLQVLEREIVPLKEPILAFIENDLKIKPKSGEISDKFNRMCQGLFKPKDMKTYITESRDKNKIITKFIRDFEASRQRLSMANFSKLKACSQMQFGLENPMKDNCHSSIAKQSRGPNNESVATLGKPNKIQVDQRRATFFSQAKNKLNLKSERQNEDEDLVFEDYRRRAKSFMPLGSPSRKRKSSKVEVLRRLHAKIRVLQMGQRSHSLQQNFEDMGGAQLKSPFSPKNILTETTENDGIKNSNFAQSREQIGLTITQTESSSTRLKRFDSNLANLSNGANGVSLSKVRRISRMLSSPTSKIGINIGADLGPGWGKGLLGHGALGSERDRRTSMISKNQGKVVNQSSGDLGEVGRRLEQIQELNPEMIRKSLIKKMKFSDIQVLSSFIDD